MVFERSTAKCLLCSGINEEAPLHRERSVIFVLFKHYYCKGKYVNRVIMGQSTGKSKVRGCTLKIVAWWILFFWKLNDNKCFNLNQIKGFLQILGLLVPPIVQHRHTAHEANRQFLIVRSVQNDLTLYDPNCKPIVEKKRTNESGIKILQELQWLILCSWSTSKLAWHHIHYCYNWPCHWALGHSKSIVCWWCPCQWGTWTPHWEMYLPPRSRWASLETNTYTCNSPQPQLSPEKNETQQLT